MNISYTKKFIKKTNQFFNKHPNLRPKVKKIFCLLEENPYHPSLRLHELKGEHKGIHSISINLSYRITLELKITKDEIIPLNIGNHDEVYK